MEVNNGYKLTEVGIIPEDWSVKKISEFANVATGRTPPTHDDANYGEEYLFIGPGDLGKRKYISESEKKLSLKGFEGSRKFPIFSVLFTCIGSTIGKSGIASCELTSNQQINAIFPGDLHNSNYLYYFLSLNSNRIKSMAGEQALPMINKSEFQKISVAFPTLNEQNMIATVISEIDVLIETIEKVIAKKREIRREIMHALVTGRKKLISSSKKWSNYRVGDLVTFSGGSQPPRSVFNFKPRPGFIRLIQMRDYKTDNYITYIPEGLAQKKCLATDVMIGRYGPPIFQIYRGLEGAYNVALIKAIPSEKLDSDFLYYFFLQDKLFNFIDNLSRRSAGQSGVDLPALKNYPIDLPPLEEQKEIASILKDMDDELKELVMKKNKYVDVKNGMMQELLTGRIRLI